MSGSKLTILNLEPGNLSGTIRGELALGEKLDVTIKPPRGTSWSSQTYTLQLQDKDANVLATVNPTILDDNLTGELDLDTTELSNEFSSYGNTQTVTGYLILYGESEKDCYFKKEATVQYQNLDPAGTTPATNLSPGGRTDHSIGEVVSEAWQFVTRLSWLGGGVNSASNDDNPADSDQFLQSDTSGNAASTTWGKIKTLIATYIRGNVKLDDLQAPDDNTDLDATTSKHGLHSKSDKTKIDGIETGATADQTDSEIKTAYENNADTNAFTDSEESKLAGIESGATADQTDAEIRSTSLQTIGSPTYTTIQELQNIFHSAGIFSGGHITDAGSGQIEVSAGTGAIRATNDKVDTLYWFDFPALSATTITDGSTEYVGVQYNAGSPQVVVETDDTWNNQTEFRLGTVSRDGSTLHISNNPHVVGDHASLMAERGRDVNPLARSQKDGGLILSDVGTRNVKITAGVLWEGLNLVSLSEKDTSGTDTMQRIYRDGSGGWAYESGETQWNNTQIDDGSGSLLTMDNNKWAAQYIYEDVEGQVIHQFGQNQYPNKSGVEAEEIPPRPFWFEDHAKFVGRIIFQKGASTGTVESVFTTTFQSAEPTQHNDLGGLQGGTSSEYYHFTSQQHTDLTGLTSSEITQLQNINTVTITNTQWGYLGGLGSQPLETDGSVALTSNWDIGDGKRVEADEIRARDGDGLRLYDDGGAGIFVQDGGYVGINTTPIERFHVAEDSSPLTFKLERTGTNPSALKLSALGNYTAMNAAVGARFDLLHKGYNGIRIIEGDVAVGAFNPNTKLDVGGAVTRRELSADPTDPDEGSHVVWQSDGTGSGADGDIMMKITAGGTTKTTTLVDFSAV